MPTALASLPWPVRPFKTRDSAMAVRLYHLTTREQEVLIRHAYAKEDGCKVLLQSRPLPPPEHANGGSPRSFRSRFLSATPFGAGNVKPECLSGATELRNCTRHIPSIVTHQPRNWKVNGQGRAFGLWSRGRSAPATVSARLTSPRCIPLPQLRVVRRCSGYLGVVGLNGTIIRR